MGRKSDEYCNLYRLTNTKTGEMFEARRWKEVLKKAGLCLTTAPTALARSKRWDLQKLEGPLHWDEEAYRKQLYKRTKSRYHRYEEAKKVRDPLYQKRKRLKQKKWINKDGTPFTAEQHEQMIKCACEICNTTEKIVVDHDHSTNKVRGSLCRLCNTALGHARENVQILQRMINYLEEKGR